MSEPKVLIEFVRAWGHPTRNEVYGPPQRFWVSEWAAENLVSGAYAKRAEPTASECSPGIGVRQQ